MFPSSCTVLTYKLQDQPNTDTQKYSLKFQQNSPIPEAELLSTYSSPSIVFSIPNYNIRTNFSDRCFRTSSVRYYAYQHWQPRTTYSTKWPKNFNCDSKTKNNTITLTRLSRDLTTDHWHGPLIIYDDMDYSDPWYGQTYRSNTDDWKNGRWPYTD